MEFVDYYKTMGLDEKATADDVRKAYRRLARKYHPDVSKEPDSEARFKAIGEAYAVLKNKERRAEYDELRRYGGTQAGGFRPPPGWQSRAGAEGAGGRGFGGFGGADPGDFSDFFKEMFGQRGRGPAGHSRRQPARGDDINATLSVRLRDVFEGARLPLSLQIPTEHSNGHIDNQTRTLQVTIPKGMTHGQKIRLRGQGYPGPSNRQAGDLYIELDVKEDSTFKLEGRDITVTVPITPWQAALGGRVSVPTLGGDVSLTLPPNTRGGQRMRLRGRGLPARNDGEAGGDQYAILDIVMPEVTSERQREALRQLAALFDDTPGSQSSQRQAS